MSTKLLNHLSKLSLNDDSDVVMLNYPTFGKDFIKGTLAKKIFDERIDELVKKGYKPIVRDDSGHIIKKDGEKYYEIVGFDTVDDDSSSED